MCFSAPWHFGYFRTRRLWPAKPTWQFPTCTRGILRSADKTISAWNLLFGGAWVIMGTLGISLFLRYQIKNLPAHESMLKISEIIFQTCKTYLIQQGKFLLMLFAIIASAMTYYFIGPAEASRSRRHCWCLFFSVVGMVGSYCGRLVRHPR